jgi:general stress protein 26
MTNNNSTGNITDFYFDTANETAVVNVINTVVIVAVALSVVCHTVVIVIVAFSKVDNKQQQY